MDVFPTLGSNGLVPICKCGRSPSHCSIFQDQQSGAYFIIKGYQPRVFGSPNDGKSQPECVVAFVVVDQSFGVAIEILGLQIEVQTFSQ